MANENRLIDAVALIRDINADIYRTESEKSYDRCLVYRQPTVDAVEVVQCRDCAVPHNKYTGCPKLNGLVTTPDFYCPFGKRKDGDGNG